MKEEKFIKFQELANLLNDKIDVIPLLYGSLGLEVLTGDEFDSDDVDILIPKCYIFEDWNILVDLLEDQDYKLIDLHEHTFEKYGIAFSFAYIEAVEEYANVSINEIKTIVADNCKYKLLSLDQYLAVYQKSVCDDYRKSHGKTPKDLDKVNYLKEKIAQANA